MSIMDAFTPEQKIEVKFGTFYELIKEAAKADLLMNAVKCDMPPVYIREMAEGKPEAKQNVSYSFYASKFFRNEDVPEEESEPAAGPEEDEGQQAAAEEKERPAAGGGIPVSCVTQKSVAPENFKQALQGMEPGTEVYINLKNGKIVKAVLVGKSHYEKGDLVFRISYIGRHRMNKENKNAGGWKASEMRSYLNNDFFQLLPGWLKDLIRPHKMIQKQGDEVVECEDKLFLPSEFELQGVNEIANYNGVDSLFPFFEIRKNRLVFDEEEDGCPTWFWTADPSAANAANFCSFATDGISTDLGASNAGGVAPLFVI